MDVLVRVAEEGDFKAACTVLRRSIAECCFQDHGNDQSILNLWLANKTPEQVRHWLRDSNSYAVVAQANGTIVGVATLLKSGEVTLCYVVPEVRFTGVGRALLAELEIKANDLGLRQLNLVSTKTAHSFYLRNGYESSGPPEFALAMEGYPMFKALGIQSASARVRRCTK